MLFDTVLVANRGEIARRVIRTLRALGIRSVAVYSDADATAPHVREADAAVRIGPAPAAQSYLDVEAVVRAAVESGAQAVHPGYGFLSENVAFARACAAAGIVFIGPGEQALAVMGDKIRAKEHVARHEVPTVPGFSAAGMTDAEIAAAAERTGYPLLVKPSAGGGGKGMQVVRAASELAEALSTARRVAAAAFGDDTLLLERLIERPRHIEVQVLADQHGHVVHLGERECTLQRRHQKVIEEAPSPVVDATTRERLGAAACAAAASVEYRGAGTVEFLVAASRPDEFFFIEMNTRLQVEHPVTELVTGLDLVEQQLRIAAGEPLGFAQADVRLDGHAIEARVYAESPERGFLPATGEVLAWRAATDVRTDAAVETGSVVTADYDPMIAKVIAHGGDRVEALARLDAALAETVVLGVDTNLGFLRQLLAQDHVRSGDMDTGLIDRMPAPTAPAPGDLALRAAAAFVRARRDAGIAAPRRDSPSSAPRTWSLGDDVRSRRSGATWQGLTGWRAGGAPVNPAVAFETADGGILVAAPDERSPEVSVGSRPAHARRLGAAAPDGVTLAAAADGMLWVHADGATTALRPLSRRAAMERRLAARERAAAASDPELRAPMPGAVVAVHVAPGATVAAGDRVLTIEAMKMEHPVLAPHAGVVRVDVATGDQVRRDEVIAHVAVAPAPMPDDPDPTSAEAHEAAATHS
ncbi:biotin carboxylase N-terminal domain-containing protein [Microbacterium sp. M3]|uniref:biotin carboxylase n=1 Tax=Microbacterium arthrosphaerae TaxID=792652 RepID=A0ABU4H0X8_9MICO|nr:MULTISPECIES: biotin carboxylase N-terminal domain-containing protein [Microbacterium]MDW4572407.1 biotin carboxylase N-terminal domain-containing protein [Microbacterium arthrosphaerae]MDW7606262.1 biotin carboxylase N-terminal domain-containing protein [Microbacterium sp. M3]